MSKYTAKEAKIRLYDGTGTPFYLELVLDSDMSGPLGAPKTEENLVLNRGNMDSNAHYVEGPDDPMMEPVDVTFTVLAQDTAFFGYLLDWLEGNTVNSNTIVTTKEDTQRDGSNNNPAFADSGKKCCNVEYKLDGDVDIVWHYNEVWFDLSQITFSEAEDGVSVSMTGKCYGTIVRDSAFTAGNDVTA